MTRSDLELRLGTLKPRLADYGVRSLRVFGSTLRGEARQDSDVDLIVEFDGSSTFDRYFGLLVFLEDSLGTGVDLVEPEALHPRIRERVLSEALRVA